jgi:23S rRNA pseudouridine1911/1915/1917 synthase
MEKNHPAYMRFSSTVPANIRKPVPAVDYLANRFTYHTHDAWAELVRAGRVFVNDERRDESAFVKAGDAVAYEPEPFEEPGADLSYSIIYEDEWALCVNKPGNLLVHRAGKSFRNNLTYLLRNNNAPPYPNCRPAHRLDRGTSGAVLFAKTAEYGSAFGNLFRDSKVVKRYAALVRECPNIDTPFIIDKPIAPDESAIPGSSPCKFKVNESGKPAVTVIDNAKRLDNGFSLLSIRPLTGRTHQIRVHLSSIGFPIIGDTAYSGDDSLFPRLALHCESLSFTHPCTNTECTITAPFPDDFKSH